MRRVLFLTPFLFVLNACPTIWQFNALKERVTTLEDENRQLRRELDQHGTRLENLGSKTDTELENIVMRGASSAAQIDEIVGEQTRMKGRLEELEFYLARVKEMAERMATVMDDRFGANVQAVPDYAPKDKDERLKFAAEKLTQGDTKTARSVARTLLTDFPNDDVADDAQFLTGESYYVEKKFTEAIREYRAVHDKYRKSPLVLKALLRIGDCFEASSACKKAQQIYEYARDFAKEKADKDDVAQRLKALKKSCQ